MVVTENAPDRRARSPEDLERVGNRVGGFTDSDGNR